VPSGYGLDRGSGGSSCEFLPARLEAVDPNPISEANPAFGQHLVEIAHRYVVRRCNLLGTQVWVMEVSAGVFEDP